MSKVCFKIASMANLLNLNSILTTFITLLILQFGINRIQFVSSSGTTTPFPDPNARAVTIAPKLENHHIPTTPAPNTSTNGYINVYNGNDSYGKI